MWKLPGGRDWLWGNLGLALMAGAMLNKSLIQFSVDEWGCVRSLLFDLRPNYGRGNDDLPKGLSQDCCNQCPQPHGSHSQLTSLPETSRHLQASLAQSLVGSLLPSHRSWCTQGSVCALQESVSAVRCKFWWLYGGVNGNLLQEGLCHTQVCCAQSPCPCSRPLLTRTSTGDTQTLKGRSGSVSVGSLGPGVHKILCEPSKHLC